MPKKRAMLPRKNLVSLIKNVARGQQETKMAIQSFGSNMFHNVSLKVFNNNLATTQGVTDGSALSNRIGDTVLPVGLKLFMQFRQPVDRPNVSWKVWVLKVFGSASAPTFLPRKNITGNLFLDPIDTEACSVVKVINFKADDNYWQGSNATSKESCHFRKVWIPLPSVPYVYSGDNASQGKRYTIVTYAACYDTFGTLETDNIGTINFQSVFYFKDA